MVLKFFKNNDLIFVSKNRKVLRDTLKKNKIKSFNEKVIREGLRNSNTFTKRVGKTDYRIEEVNKKRHINNIGKVEKSTKSISVLTGHNVRGTINEIIFKKKKKLLMSPDANENIIILQNLFIETVKKSIKTVQKVKFQVRIKYTNDINSSLYKYASTIFTSYNKMLEVNNRILNKVNEISELYNKIAGYGQDVVIKEFVIRYYKVPKLKKQLVLGSNDNQKLLDNYFYEMIKEEETKNKLLKFIKKFIIMSVNTSKRCFIKSVLHCKYPDKDNKKINSLICTIDRDCDFSKEVNELENMGKILSSYLKIKIKVYNQDLDIEEVYGDEFKEVAQVLVIHGHSFYLKDRVDRLDTKHFLNIDDKQYPMIPKNKKNKDDKPKIIYGAYDYETYNVYEDELERKAEVKPFALGFCVNGEYNEFFKGKPIKYKYEYNEEKEILEKVKTEELIEDDITNKFLNKFYKLEKNYKDKTKIILYAHNGGKFDIYNILLTFIKKGKHIYSILPKDGRIISFSMIITKKLIVEFRDSICLVQGKLDKLLEDFKCEIKKLTGTVDYEYVNEKNYYKKEVKNMFKKYLENDVKGLYELIIKIKKIIKETYDINLDECLTNASIARKYFIKNHDWVKYPLYNIPLKEYEKLKKHYIGGRNECFYMGEYTGKVYYYDFTSLYPYIMSIKYFPYGKYKKVIPENQNKFNKKWFGVIKCLVKSTKQDFKPLHGIKENGKLLFRHFKDFTELYLSTEEIRYSIENKLYYEYKFIEVYDYANKKSKFFKSMVDGGYKLKIDAEEKGNEPLRQMAKIIINSIYGFWGIKITGLEHMDIKSFNDDMKKKFYFQKTMSQDKLIDFKDVGDKHSIITTRDNIDIMCANIIIAMMTTSYSRIELYKLITDVEKSGGKIFYCDTDSIITDYCIENNNKLSNKYRCIPAKTKDIKLGDLTNETHNKAGYYNGLVVLGCKSYCLYNTEGQTYTTNDGEVKKVKDELKFKGINTKSKYDNREYKKVDGKEKIILTKLNKDGIHTINVDDYKKMSNGYILESEFFNFVASIKKVDGKEALRYVKNDKKSCKQYNKGIIEGNIINPLYY